MGSQLLEPPPLHVLVLHVDGHGDLLSRLDGDLERLAVGRHDHGGVDVALQEGLGQSQHLAGCGTSRTAGLVSSFISGFLSSRSPLHKQ